MSAALATNRVVACEVAVFPFQGGATFISGQNAGLRACTVSRPLRGNFGTCELTLAPGGPTGMSSQSWTQLVPVYSLVIVGMTRGNQSRIVFAGIVTKVGESQSWSAGGVERDTLIEAADFGYILATSEFYALSALLAGPAAVLPLPAVLSIAAPGLRAGTPDQIAQAYYSEIICSPPSTILGTLGGVFQSMKFNVAGTKSSFFNLVATLFAPWDGVATIPAAVNFLSSEDSFISKIKAILTEPFYESWFDVAAIGAYTGKAAATQLPTPGVLTYEPASIFFVNRVCPLPKLMNSGTLLAPKYSMNLDAWNALPVTTVTGFIESSISFQADDLGNFFSINPLTISTMFGASNSNLTAFIATQCVYLNAASIEQFGLRTSVVDTTWFCDSDGIQAVAATANDTVDSFSANFQQMLVRLVGYGTPIPWLAAGSLTIPSDPTIGVGQCLTFCPFKDSVLWQFYIVDVVHEFVFGSHSHTTLTLERGLPVAVYQNAPLLTALHTGNASLIAGAAGGYAMNPAGTLGVVGVSLAQQAGNNSGYATPQGGQQPS